MNLYLSDLMSPKSIPSLCVCIPTYKRPFGAIAAANSVLSQIADFEPIEVRVLISEDCGADGDYEQIAMALDGNPYVKLTRNNSNYGMSKNIQCMLRGQSTDYCMILTDDDVLLAGSGRYISDLICHQSTGIFFGPRQCALEDGTIKSNATDLGRSSGRIQQTPFNFGSISTSFFILSGLILDPSEIQYDLWSLHLENAFFPVLFGYSAYKRKGSFYYSKPVVKHTVLNKCYWERWGESQHEIELRLAQDFFDTLRLIENDQETYIDKVACMAGSLPSRSVHLLQCLVAPLLSIHRSTRCLASSYVIPYLRIYFSSYQNFLALFWVPFAASKILIKRVLAS